MYPLHIKLMLRIRPPAVQINSGIMPNSHTNLGELYSLITTLYGHFFNIFIINKWNTYLLIICTNLIPVYIKAHFKF